MFEGSYFSTTLSMHIIFIFYYRCRSGCKVYLIVVLIYISLITNDIEHLLIYLWEFVFFFGKHLFMFFGYIVTALFF